MYKRNIADISGEGDTKSELSNKKPTKQKRYYDMVNNMNMLLIDCQEAQEPMPYVFKVASAPRRLRRRLYMNHLQGKKNFNSVYFDDGADGTDGLIDESDEYEEGDIYEDVSAWMTHMSTNLNKLRAPFRGVIDFVVSLTTA